MVKDESDAVAGTSPTPSKKNKKMSKAEKLKEARLRAKKWAAERKLAKAGFASPTRSKKTTTAKEEAVAEEEEEEEEDGEEEEEDNEKIAEDDGDEDEGPPVARESKKTSGTKKLKREALQEARNRAAAWSASRKMGSPVSSASPYSSGKKRAATPPTSAKPKRPHVQHDDDEEMEEAADGEQTEAQEQPTETLPPTFPTSSATSTLASMPSSLNARGNDHTAAEASPHHVAFAPMPPSLSFQKPQRIRRVATPGFRRNSLNAPHATEPIADSGLFSTTPVSLSSKSDSVPFPLRDFNTPEDTSQLQTPNTDDATHIDSLPPTPASLQQPQQLQFNTSKMTTISPNETNDFVDKNDSQPDLPFVDASESVPSPVDFRPSAYASAVAAAEAKADRVLEHDVQMIQQSIDASLKAAEIVPSPLSNHPTNNDRLGTSPDPTTPEPIAPATVHGFLWTILAVLAKIVIVSFCFVTMVSATYFFLDTFSMPMNEGGGSALVLFEDSATDKPIKSPNPPCYVDSVESHPNPLPASSMVDTLDNGQCHQLDPVPCPEHGRCFAGFLHDCLLEGWVLAQCHGRDCAHIDAKPSQVPIFIPTRFDGTDVQSCVLSPDATEAISFLKHTLVDLFVEQTCNSDCKRSSWFSWGGGGTPCPIRYDEVSTLSELQNKMLTREGQNDGRHISDDNSESDYAMFSVEAVTRLIASLSSDDGHVPNNWIDAQAVVIIGQHIDDDLVVVCVPFQEEDQNEESIAKSTEENICFVGLSEDFIHMSLPIPLACWIRIFVWDLLQAALNFVVSFFYRMATDLWIACSNYPFRALCFCAILYGMTWMHALRRGRAELRDRVTFLREWAYDKLASCDDGEGYAELHLRDDIAHELHPNSLKRRRDLYENVWPRVVNEIRHDNRIRKSVRTVGGKRLAYWEWVAHTAKKNRRKNRGLRNEDDPAVLSPVPLASFSTPSSSGDN